MTTALFLLLVLSGATSILRAQSFRGGIRGEVTDAKDLRVAGAKIVARNLATSGTREITADESGEFRFVELPAGSYEISAMAPGFQEVHAPQVVVNVGEETVVNLRLAKVTEKQESIVVTDAVPLVDTTDTTLSQVVDRQLVEELPLNGRDFGKLVALTPGVTVEGSGVAGTEKGFGQFNINGNRDRSNNYALDGTDNNDPFFNNSALNQVGITGAPATLLPLDAIQEFNLQSQFGAEYGRNSGAMVNIVTRSGSNNFHGSLYEYNRNSNFDARNYFNTKLNPDGSFNPQSPFNNNNFGGSLGGPIKKDHAFFFLAYEGQRETVGSDFNLVVPTAKQIATARAEALAVNPSINMAPLDNIIALMPTTTDAVNNFLPYTVQDTNNNNNLIAKVDFNPSEKNSITGRYAFGQSNQAFPLGSLGGFGSGSRISTFEQLSPTRVQVVSASWLSTFSPEKVNEVRFGYSRFRTSFNSADATPGNPNYIDPSALGLDMGTNHVGLPEIDFNAAIENLGATAFSVPRGRISQTYQILDNFTLIRGRHTMKFGGEYHRYDVQSFNDNLERGLLDVTNLNVDPNFIVDSLASFYLGSFFTSTDTGRTNRDTFNNNLGFFAQDEWRVRSNLTVIAGLRWEYFGPLGEKNNLLSNFDKNGNLLQAGSPTLPHVYNRDLNNFGPRLGISWNPRANTVIRAAYGIYYDYTPQNNMIANFTNSAGLATNPVPSLAGTPNFVGGMDFNILAWTGGAAAGPVFTPTVNPQSIFITDLNLRTPYVQNWNLNIQQQINPAVAFEVSYVASKGTKITRLYDKNQDFTNPNYAVIDVFSGSANSTYNALQTTARLQNFHGLSGFSTYAFAKSLDGASDGIDFNFATAAFPQNSDNVAAEKGPSTFDTRHRWTTALTYVVPTFNALPHALGAGWQLNTVITVQSGRPIPIITANDTSGTFNFTSVRMLSRVSRSFFLTGCQIHRLSKPLRLSSPPTAFFWVTSVATKFTAGFRNLDFSVTKNFQFREHHTLSCAGVSSISNVELRSALNAIIRCQRGRHKESQHGSVGSITQTPTWPSARTRRRGPA
jgi:outer membrane receptor protein involved in Fe transport